MRLLDTSVLVRLRNANDPHHDDCRALFASFETGPNGACLVAQVLIEYWVVATRPAANNGLGLSSADADADLTDFFEAVALPGGAAGRAPKVAFARRRNRHEGPARS